MKKYLLTSISLHMALLIAAGILGFCWYDKYEHISRIDVYLSDNYWSQTRKSDSNPSSLTGVRPEKRSQTLSHRKGQTSFFGSDPSLTQTLHDLIQKQIQLQSNFLSKFGKRKTYLSFTLFPDGHIENGEILQSSGIATLDQTAFEGLMALPKINEAQKLLEKPENFKVCVEFV